MSQPTSPTPAAPTAPREPVFTREEWQTLPVLIAFRRFSNAHFTMAADEYRENTSDSSVTKHYDAAHAAEQELLKAIRAHASQEAAQRITRLMNVARGCHDYRGGHRDSREAEIFHHGIQTVINALEAAAKNDPADTQVNALEQIGAVAALQKRTEKPNASFKST